MKINYFLIVTLLITATALNSHADYNRSKGSSIEEFQSCRCYCSELCGPRNSKPGDKPFYDEETGMCFCAQRDKDNYYKNGCHLEPKLEETTCCPIPTVTEE